VRADLIKARNMPPRQPLLSPLVTDLSAVQNSADQPQVAFDPEFIPTKQLDRLAPLIAEGHMPFPSNLAPDTAARLVEKVRSIRRDQLIQFVALQIARTIVANRDHS
jgi:hypothetical protein